MTTTTEEKRYVGIRLSDAEEADYERLYQQKVSLERKEAELRSKARMAVQQRNLITKERERVLALWLPLAEKKFPYCRTASVFVGGGKLTAENAEIPKEAA